MMVKSSPFRIDFNDDIWKNFYRSVKNVKNQEEQNNTNEGILDNIRMLQYQIDDSTTTIRTLDDKLKRMEESTCIKEDFTEPKKDNVNHPSHYESSCSLECIDVMEAMFGDISVYDFCICNAFKYLWRYKNKNGKEDISKAEWYINRARKLSSEMDMFSDDFLAKELSRMEKLLDQVREKEKMEANNES